MEAAKKKAIQQVLADNVPNFDSLDSTVTDYVVSVLLTLIQDSTNPNPVARKDPTTDDVHNLSSMVSGQGVFDGEEDAFNCWLKIFPLLQLSTANISPTNGDQEVKTLAKPIMIKSTEEVPKKTERREENSVLTYLSCELKERNSTNPVDDFLTNTASPDPKIRKLYLRELCPCHVQRDIEVVWDRIIQMTSDEDPDVRYQVLHNLCDGSPSSRETEVIEALEKLHNDSDPKIRRRVHQVLTHYRKTGKWNIL